MLVDKAEDVPKFKDFKPEPVKKAPAAAAAATTPSPAPAAAPPPPPPPPPAAAQAPAAHGDRVIASPLAKSIARESGVDLRGLAGTGPGGRIIAADVAAAKGTNSLVFSTLSNRRGSLHSSTRPASCRSARQCCSCSGSSRSGGRRLHRPATEQHPQGDRYKTLTVEANHPTLLSQYRCSCR